MTFVILEWDDAFSMVKGHSHLDWGDAFDIYNNSYIDSTRLEMGDSWSQLVGCYSPFAASM